MYNILIFGELILWLIINFTVSMPNTYRILLLIFHILYVTCVSMLYMNK